MANDDFTHTEVWRPIPDWNGYEVSSCGNVRSVQRVIVSKANNTWLQPGKCLALQFNDCGYRTVRLRGTNKKSQVMKVHRLVASAFIPLVEGKPFVNHKDSDPTNNRIENLEWCTQAENLAHARSLGRMRHQIAAPHRVELPKPRVQGFDRLFQKLGEVLDPPVASPRGGPAKE